MKNYSVWIIILFLIGNSHISSLKADTIPSINLTTISQVNQGNSYFTFPTDIGNLEPLWFEGNLIPNFHIRKSENSRLMGVLTPQVIIRMYQEYSFPVKTPSYIPQLTMYYMFYPKRRTNTLYFRIVHHSNGQFGSFYLPDGTINVDSGDFSTNFLELGIIRAFYNTSFNVNQFFKTSFVRHFIIPDNFQNGIYSKLRLKNSFSVYKIRQDNSKTGNKKAGFSIKLDTEWRFGDTYTWSEKTIDRLNIGLTAFYAPKFFEDFGLFVEFYHGEDYYNIYFNHQINVIRFGIMTELLRF